MVRVYRTYGYVAQGFETVREAFEQNFREGGEVGAAVAVYHKGKKVVDLWGGYRNLRKEPWEEETMVMIFSTTKGFSSLALSKLHSQTGFDYDMPVAEVWPAFSAYGKEAISIRQLLAHTAGLCAPNFRITPELIRDENRMAEFLASQKPLWTPGKKKGYHAWTIALYLNELFRRIDPGKRNLSSYFKEEIADPLGLKSSIGLSPDTPDNVVADLVPMEFLDLLLERDRSPYMSSYESIGRLLNPFSLTHRTLLNPRFTMYLPNFNKREIRQLPIGSAIGFSTARDVARAYHEFALGTPVLALRPESLEELERSVNDPVSLSLDLVIHLNLPMSLGMAKPSPQLDFGMNDRSYGNFGAGGSGGFADPELQLGYGYVMNKMGSYIVNDPRELRLRKALYAIFGKDLRTG